MDKVLDKTKEMILEPQQNKQKNYSNQNEQNLPKYKREDSISGYLNDIDEIEEYKNTQRLEILQNKLLGEFNEYGDYIIADEIKREVFRAKKEVVQQYKNMIFLHSVFPIPSFGVVSYVVSVTKLEDGRIKSQLILLEKINKVNGYIINTLSSLIDEYTEITSPKYYEEMNKHFNIIKVDQKKLDDLQDDTTFYYSEQRKIKLLNSWKKIRKNVEKTQKEKFERRMEILLQMQDNVFAKRLIELFNAEKAKIDKLFLKDKEEYFSACIELLNYCFDKIKDDSKEANAVKNEFKKNHNESQIINGDAGKDDYKNFDLNKNNNNDTFIKSDNTKQNKDNNEGKQNNNENKQNNKGENKQNNKGENKQENVDINAGTKDNGSGKNESGKNESGKNGSGKNGSGKKEDVNKIEYSKEEIIEANKQGKEDWDIIYERKKYDYGREILPGNTASSELNQTESVDHYSAAFADNLFLVSNETQVGAPIEKKGSQIEEDKAKILDTEKQHEAPITIEKSEDELGR